MSDTIPTAFQQHPRRHHSAYASTGTRTSMSPTKLAVPKPMIPTTSNESVDTAHNMARRIKGGGVYDKQTRGINEHRDPKSDENTEIPISDEGCHGKAPTHATRAGARTRTIKVNVEGAPIHINDAGAAHEQLIGRRCGQDAASYKINGSIHLCGPDNGLYKGGNSSGEELAAPALTLLHPTTNSKQHGTTVTRSGATRSTARSANGSHAAYQSAHHCERAARGDIQSVPLDRGAGSNDNRRPARQNRS